MSIEEIPQGADVNVIPKNEKKARELIKKLNLKQIKGISRVTFKQRGNLIYAIDSRMSTDLLLVLMLSLVKLKLMT